MDYTYLADLAKEVNIPKDGVISRTLYVDEQVKGRMFATPVRLPKRNSLR